MRNDIRISITFYVLAKDVQTVRDVRPMQFVRLVPGAVVWTVVVVPVSVFAQHVETVGLVEGVDPAVVHFCGWVVAKCGEEGGGGAGAG